MSQCSYAWAFSVLYMHKLMLNIHVWIVDYRGTPAPTIRLQVFGEKDGCHSSLHIYIIHCVTNFHFWNIRKTVYFKALKTNLLFWLNTGAFESRHFLHLISLKNFLICQILRICVVGWASSFHSNVCSYSMNRPELSVHTSFEKKNPEFVSVL